MDVETVLLKRLPSLLKVLITPISLHRRGLTSFINHFGMHRSQGTLGAFMGGYISISSPFLAA